MRMLGLVLAMSVLGGVACAEPAVNFTPETATILVDGEPVLRYRYEGVPFKPYVDLATTPSGVNILRDAPHDHLHHHGLMYAIMINNTNFWEEAREPGVQGHRAFTGLACKANNTYFISALRWTGHEANPPVDVTETRRIAWLGDHDGARLLHWQTRFLADSPSTLGGAHYHGLGMRFLESMDAGGTFRVEGNAEGEQVRGTEYLTPGKWAAYTAKADGKTVTVAMFDAPENPRPALWFTMTEPFAYLSATINLHREPLEVEGEFVLDYGVALWDGEASVQAIETAYETWRTHQQ